MHQQQRQFMGDLLWVIFSYSLVGYIVLFLIDDFFPGFVSNVFNLHIPLGVVVVSLFLLIPFLEEVQEKTYSVSHVTIVVVTILGGLIMLGRLWGAGAALAVPLAILGAGILYGSLRVLANEGGDILPK